MRTVAQSLLMMLALAGCIGCASDKGPAKDFSIIPLDDQAKTVTLADFKGKTVLLDFWATWCGPCKALMPEVQSVWDKYHAKGFEVVSLSAEPRSIVLAFHHLAGFTFPIYLDPNGAANVTYRVSQIPHVVLIKDGRILWEQVGVLDGELESHVAAAMN